MKYGRENVKNLGRGSSGVETKILLVILATKIAGKSKDYKCSTVLDKIPGRK